MCEFLSAIKKGRSLLYLTAYDIYETNKGNQLGLFTGNPEDYGGHGAIRYYYGTEKPDGTIEPMKEGENVEYTDFSEPSKLPKKIVKDILAGNFKGVAECPGQLYSPSFLKKYRKFLDERFKDYYKAVNTLFEWKSKVLSKIRVNLPDVMQERKTVAVVIESIEEATQIIATQLRNDNLISIYRDSWKFFENPKNRAKAWRNL